MITDWLDQYGDPEIERQVERGAKELQKQHLIDMMSQDEELELYDEHKQKALEEQEEARKYAELSYYGDEVGAFVNGSEWKRKKSFSEEEMKSAFKTGFSIGYGSDTHAIAEKDKSCEEWFKKF